jgi:penicillin-binding protein 1A
VLERHQPQAQRAMEPQVAYLLSNMMEGVIDRGTATALADLDLDLAGKTGTTDAFTDAWFAGFSPTHTLVVWVGFDEKKTLGRNMTGAEAALPIWREIAVRGLAEGWFPRGRFAPPQGIVFREIDAESGLLATAAAPHPIREAFLAGTEPDRDYEARWSRILELPWYQQRPFYTAPRERERMPEAISDWSLVEQARAETEG